MEHDAYVALVAAGCWLAIGGAVLGAKFANAIRPALRARLASAQAELTREARRAQRARDGVGTMILGTLKAAWRMRRVAAVAAPPVPRDDVAARPPDLVVAAVGTLLGLAAVVNERLLADVLPDLLGIAPSARAVGIGRIFVVVAPSAVVLAEAVGGLAIVRDKVGVATMFLPCFAFELFAAGRRAVEIAYVGAASEDGGYSWVLGAHAAAYVAIAVLLPLLIFNSARCLEPVIVGATPSRTVRQSITKLLALSQNLILTAAVLSVVVAMSVGWILLAAVSAALMVIEIGLRFGVRPSVELLLLAFCDFPAFILSSLTDAARAIRRTRRVGAAIAAALVAIAVVGLVWRGSAFGGDAPAAAVETVAGPAPPFAVEELLAMRTVDLSAQLQARIAVRRVAAPRLVLCIVDATASVSPAIRAATRHTCASSVANLAPEFVGAVMPISDAGLASTVPIVWRPATATAVTCAPDATLPPVPPQSTLFDLQLTYARRRLERRTADCQAAVATEYRAAADAIGTAAPDFVARATRNLAATTFGHTDLLGTLARIPELIEQARRRAPTAFVDVEVYVLSDLVDDVQCRRPAADDCDSDGVAAVRRLSALPALQLHFHQVIAPARSRQQLAATWRTLWAALVPNASFEIWSPEVPL